MEANSKSLQSLNSGFDGGEHLRHRVCALHLRKSHSAEEVCAYRCNHGRMVAMVCKQDGDKPSSKSIYPSALYISHTRTGNPRRSFAKARPCWRVAPRMAILLLRIRASDLPPRITGRLADISLGIATQQTPSDVLLPSACCLCLHIPSYGLLLEPIPQSDWWLFVEVCMARVLDVPDTFARELISLPNSSGQPAPAAC